MRFFVARAAAGGIDVFRIFDSLNWVENMRVSIDAVRESGKLCEAAICYTGNLSDPHENEVHLDYYLKHRARAEGRRHPRARRSRTWPACAARAPPTRWSRR